MGEYAPIPAYSAIPLTRELAEKFATDLARMADQIPLVRYSAEDIVAEQKGDRQLLNKWQHSLVVMDSGYPVGFVMGYERQAEGNVQYPDNTLYISELAVTQQYQQRGIARSLLEQFFDMNNTVGFQTLPGEVNYSVQTNAADWNQHVLDLYESFGFKERATKEYENRTDVVLGVAMDDLRLQ